VDASLPLMGMLSYDKKQVASIKKSEVSIAKNYLNENGSTTNLMEKC